MIFTKLECFGYGFAAGIAFCAAWVNIILFNLRRVYPEAFKKEVKR